MREVKSKSKVRQLIDPDRSSQQPTSERERSPSQTEGEPQWHPYSYSQHSPTFHNGIVYNPTMSSTTIMVLLINILTISSFLFRSPPVLEFEPKLNPCTGSPTIIEPFTTTTMTGQLKIWDLYGGGQGSVPRATSRLGDLTSVLAFDKQFLPTATKTPTTTQVTKDILTFTDSEVDYYYNKYGCDIVYVWTPCDNLSSLKNDLFQSRNVNAGYETANAGYSVVQRLLKLNPNVSFFIENPETKLIKEWANEKGLKYQITSFCLWSELIEVNGTFYETFPSCKDTVIISNVDLGLTKCNNNGCNYSRIYGHHQVVIGHRAQYSDQMTHTECCKLYEELGIIKTTKLYKPRNTTQFLWRVPEKLILHSIKCAVGMYFICFIFCFLFFV